VLRIYGICVLAVLKKELRKNALHKQWTMKAMSAMINLKKSSSTMKLSLSRQLGSIYIKDRCASGRGGYLGRLTITTFVPGRYQDTKGEKRPSCQASKVATRDRNTLIR
jgi:hypothetical protein